MLHIKELEHTATSHQDQLKAKQNDAGAVAKELDAAALQIRELEHAVTGYHDQLKAKQSDADAVAKDHNAAVLQIKELEHTIASYQDRLKAKQSNADALAKGFQEQRTVARAFREGCEANHSDFDRLLQERAVADARVQELERKIAADSRYPGTRARIHATVRNSRELRAEISDLKNQLTIARNNHDAAIVELRVSKKDRANLRRQTTNADSLNYSLEIKVATLTHVVDHVQRNLSHKEAEVKKIGGLLDREMKRRRDAEATPSSDHWKRSKKCDIEIVGVEQDGVLEAVITQPNRLQRSHHQEAAATHDTFSATGSSRCNHYFRPIVHRHSRPNAD
ncbi:hypothetical protein LTR12_015655 [Friedmanniomyces endolithicus]|nr:hypothetical protein LTR12_015655 [Friedmanniomyces endolithicus]